MPQDKDERKWLWELQDNLAKTSVIGSIIIILVLVIIAIVRLTGG